MPVPFIIFSAFFVIIVDGMTHLFKKFEDGNWATKCSNLSDGAKVGIFACFLCCLPLSIFFAFFSFRSFGMRGTFILAIFLFFAHLIYRTLMMISDKGANKCVSRNENRIKKENRVRRCFSFYFAIFSLLSAAAIIFWLQKISFFP